MDHASPFDRVQLRRQRARAAPRLADHDFLLREVGERLADRLSDVTRRFPIALDLGCHDGTMARVLAGRGGIERMIQCDISPAMAQRAAATGHPALAADEEALPFAEAAFDLVLSNLSLHWVNDLPGTLLQIRRSLKEDGLFLATLLGGETLAELRSVLIEAELAEQGGIGPRVSPFADVRDLGGLLQRAGFTLPVVDRDRIVVSYADPWRLLADLRGMGEANAVTERRKGFTRRATLMRALSLYRERFADTTGRIPATFEVLTLTAWRAHSSQPRPLAPGSGQVDLDTVLGRRTEERPL